MIWIISATRITVIITVGIISAIATIVVTAIIIHIVIVITSATVCVISMISIAAVISSCNDKINIENPYWYQFDSYSRLLLCIGEIYILVWDDDVAVSHAANNNKKSKHSQKRRI